MNCKFAVTWVCLSVLLGCSSGATPANSGSGDAGASDASRDGGAADPFAATRAEVTRLAAPLVDPSGSDTSRSVGLVVTLITASHTETLGFGATSVGGPTPDGRTAYQIGSVSKVVTGLILASLVATPGSGVASTDLVNDHLFADVRAPAFGTGPTVDITLEQLVSHYAALPTMPDNLSGPRTAPAAGYSRAALATYLRNFSLPEAPGTHYAYSNLGVGLLGVALTDTTGAASYNALLSTAVTTPLGMSSTGTNEPEYLARVADRIAQGRSSDGAALDLSDMGVLAGAGEIISTGDDMGKLLRALIGLDEFVPGAAELATHEVGRGAGPSGIGYALDIITESDGTQYEKAGVTAGFSSYIAFRRNPQVGVVILSSRGQHRAIQAAARAMISLL